MKLIKTKDNSYTFYSEKYNEAYHSTSGALEESFKKFVRLVRALIEFDKEFTEKVPDDLVPNPQQQQQPSNPLTM